MNCFFLEKCQCEICVCTFMGLRKTFVACTCGAMVLPATAVRWSYRACVQIMSPTNTHSSDTTSYPMESTNETWLSLIAFSILVSLGLLRAVLIPRNGDGERLPGLPVDRGAAPVSLHQRLLRLFGGLLPAPQDQSDADPSAVAASSPGLPADRDPRSPGPQLGCLPLYGH